MKKLFLAGLLVLFDSGYVFAAGMPHDPVTVVSASENSSSQQTDNVLFTPSSGNRLALMGCTVCVDGAVDVELEESNSDIFIVKFSGSGCQEVGGGSTPYYLSSTNDDTFDWTTSGGVDTSINCYGYQFTP